MSALENLLTAYAAATPPVWSAFGQIAGLTWSDDSPVENQDAQPENAFSRSGKLTLSGFGENDLPNGKTGPEADYVRGNEGASGVTLDGNREQVTSIAVMKFYPDSDYRKVLANQLRQALVQLMASGCRLAEGTTTGEPNTTGNQFFALTLAGGQHLFAEAMVDKEGGKYTPGSTTYFFYRSEPKDRIQSMQCRAP